MSYANLRAARLLEEQLRTPDDYLTPLQRIWRDETLSQSVASKQQRSTHDLARILLVVLTQRV